MSSQAGLRVDPIKWLKVAFDRSNDPVASCEVFKEIGCPHVDGMLCSMKDCNILREYRKRRDSPEELEKP